MNSAREFASTFQDGTRTWPNETLVTIALEDGTPPYTLPKADLTTASPYFEAALNARSSSNQDGTLRLGGAGDMPACERKTFDLFLYWLYHKAFPNPLQPPQPTETLEETYTTMVLLWHFADQYLIPKLQKAAMRSILALGTQKSLPVDKLSPAVTQLIFRLTAAESPLRRWAVRVWDYQISVLGSGGYPEWDRGCLNELGRIRDFWYEYSKAQCEQQRDPEIWKEHEEPSARREWGWFGVGREEREGESKGEAWK